MSLATLNKPLEKNTSETQGTWIEQVHQLRQRVARNSRRWKLLTLLEALGLAIAAPLAYLWLTFSIDNYFHLPLLGRLLASVGLLASVVWVSLLLVRRWRHIHLTEDQVALAIERRTPGGVQNRLINAVQIARQARERDQELSEAVIRENYQRLQQIHLEQAARLRPAMLRLGLAALASSFGLIFWLCLPDYFNNAAARIFLPLADIDPLYRTTLRVEPGNVQAGGSVTIRVIIQGERPETLTLFKNFQGKRTSEVIPVEGDGPVSYTFRDLDQSLDYAVRGGDYTTPTYHIEVARRTMLVRVRASFQYPEYTSLSERTSDSGSGDLEALQGTRARVTFVFDQPVDQVSLSLEHPASAKRPGNNTRQALTSLGPREFQGEIVFQDVVSYRLETRQGDRPPQPCGPYSLRVLKDQEPKLELSGLERRGEVALDAVLPLQISASDDLGLQTVGLYFRRAGLEQGNDWQAIVTWPGKGQTGLKQKFDLAVATLKISEGEKVEVALRARDTDPLKKEWTTGVPHEMTVGGDGVGLQLLYEQIVRSEEDLKGLVKEQQDLTSKTAAWLGKLSGQGEIRWDDPKNMDALHAAVKAAGKVQEQLRHKAGRAARDMVAQAGNLRIAVGLLADTEMIRTLRILDSVPARDRPDGKRLALADARLTQERILRSLGDILDQYRSFRLDWELAHLLPFTKMLAERQAKLHEQSKKYSVPAGESAGDRQRTSMARRQTKLLDLCQLIQPAFVRVADRVKEVEPTLSRAFTAGAGILASETLRLPMRRAAEHAQAGRWAEATQDQGTAGKILATLYNDLRQAQITAAQQALAALKERAKSDIEAQKELEKLDPGSSDRFVKDFATFKLEDTIRLREVADAKKSRHNPFEELDLAKTIFKEVDNKVIELKKDSGVRQDTDTLTLAKEPGKTPLLPMYKAKEGNKVKPFMQEKFDDLVGKLLDEADELSKSYQSIKLSTNRNNNDPGDIAKAGGSLNSTGAVTATGNQKPPTLESGGVARTGRQGARAYGMVADDDGVDRRGRDQALEGKETIADQAGLQKMQKSDDMQKTTSTGVGGKKVQSDDNHFSLADAGKWKDEMVKRLDKAQKKNYIVERQGDKIDARVAALLRDTGNKQEQIIERIKAIKKELKNLYLPTDHLDELAAALQSNLENLKDRPEAELFRLQMQTLDKLRGAMRVMRTANAGFQPSLPRERAVRGRVLDDPSRSVLPGYEEAVKNYYQKLASQ